MSISQLLELRDKFELQQYIKPSEIDSSAAVSFLGAPRKHPYDTNRVILVADPFCEQPFYYEFNTEDILTIEEQPSLSTLNGESTSMVRVWVRKKSIGLRCTPFVVDSLK